MGPGQKPRRLVFSERGSVDVHSESADVTVFVFKLISLSQEKNISFPFWSFQQDLLVIKSKDFLLLNSFQCGAYK